MKDKFYTYILQSKKTNRFYIGHTNDLSRRLMYHNSGYNPSTRSGMPWELVYIEEYTTKQDAYNRELEIKRKKSKHYIEDLIKNKRSQLGERSDAIGEVGGSTPPGST